jgi:pSer/pThr/pTyr-binding forkhead associated (FHA) protein
VNVIEEVHARAVESLVSDLNSLRRAAGNPSLGQLVRLSEDKLVKATLDDHLSGRRKRLPQWALVSAYVSACHEAAAATGLDVRRLGTLGEWQTRYEAALQGIVEAGSPVKQTANADAAVTAIDKSTTALQQLDSTGAGSQRVDADRPTVIADSQTIAPVLQQLEEKVSKRAQSLPAHTGLLVVTNGATIGMTFELDHNLTTIGRNPENDIWLNDPTVSRSHAMIHRYGEQFSIDDLNSSNGTILHGAPIHQRSTLSSYDELCIGIFVFLFVQGRTAQGKAVPRAPFRTGPLLPHSRLAEDIGKETAGFGSFPVRPDEIDWSPAYSNDLNWRRRIKWPRRRPD